MALFGTSGAVKLPGARYTFERNGLATYDVKYKVASGSSAILQQGQEAEDYSNVVLVSGSIIHTGDDCDTVELELHYEGKDTSHTDPLFTSDLTLDIASSQEPIDSHPNFLNFAGTPDSPLNGAKYDPNDGRFLFFQAEDPATSGKLNTYAGVRSYNEPIQVVSQSRIDTEWPDEDEFSLLGKIIESDYLDSQIPSLSGDRNWIYTGIRIRSIGNVYFEVTRTAALSGRRKWIDAIYDPVLSRAS